ncbi:MAG TPA: HlyD family type I secretion periplasmic adaptor subunit [Stellaceae bacterium]|nr:HlyD family type I secretion periplasmic adaptor subunit [Stellaceae bacterium]
MQSLVQSREWEIDIPRTTNRWGTFGFVFITITLLGFGVWANMAMIAGAIIAPGSFVTTGDNKTIQHLEGGVIREIDVKEGDIVQPGQVLMVLDDTVAKAEMRRLTLRYARLKAVGVRLKGEAQQATQMSFPYDLWADARDPDIAGMLNQEMMTFRAHQKNMNSDLAVLQGGIAALDERIKGTNLQISSVQEQLDLLKQELHSKRSLLSSGLIRLPEVLAVERAVANAKGELGRLQGDNGNAREQIARTQQQMQAVRNNAVKNAVDELHQVGSDLDDTRERIRAASDILQREKIRAPVRGIVVRLAYHTTGGVVASGREIMQIVPIQDDLLIEAHIRPQDIEYVKDGQSATIRLTALNQRSTPMVHGKVVYVSADALPEDRAGYTIMGGDHYVARIRLDRAEVAKEVPGFSPTPGMPAEVYIKTTERTFFQYLFRPIEDSMSRAFREP